MKTVSIITMHCPLNYGAVLQTYAFQTYLEKKGLKTSVIDYNPKYIVYDQSFMYVGDKKLAERILTRWLYRIIKYPVKSKRKRFFKFFRDQELHLTNRYETYEEIISAQLDADYFFCGSDQIWNVVSGAHLDPAYYLQFVGNKSKRYSYAASGNLPLNDEVISTVFPMINELSCISMREDSTIANIQPYINKPITHVCDPVFLLSADDWRKLYVKKANFEKIEKYVLVYPIGEGVDSTIEKGYELSKQLNIPLYNISASQRKNPRVSKQFNVDPYTFLALIDNADYVVTNSFHGTSFSIILEKQFWACVAIGSNQRISSILSEAGLEERLIYNDTYIEPQIHVDFRYAKKKLARYIETSKHFIQDIINE